ncbi:MAG: arginine--tRNA ligase [Firmicutes bacterium]|nr:arginine--tRNA ligase [Bacillota bacterium]
MYNVVDDVRHEIRSGIIAGLARSGMLEMLEDFTERDIPVEYTREKAHGDFATPIALALAGKVKRKPRDIAEAIVDHIETGRGNTRYIQRVEVAGPGFINFFLGREWLEDVLRTVLEAGSKYGRSDMGNSKRILLEFVSANPTGPMNIVNARAAAVGAGLAMIMKASGYQVATEYYVNDAGNQINVLGTSCELRYLELKGEDVTFPEWGYQGSYIIDIARQAMDKHGRELEGMDSEERAEFFRDFALSRMLADQKDSLSRFGVEFDVWFSERKLVDAGAVGKVIELLEQRDMTYEADGALWLRTTEFGDEKDRVLVKSDGDYTYLAGDIAYHKNKLERGFDLLINIWGPDHHGHVIPTRAGLEALGYPGSSLEVLLLQFLSLMSGGERVKMSKRAGEFVTMDDLIDEVGSDAARYFLLMRNIESHLEFDLNLAKEHSQANPVYYIQYAHARISSIFRQAEDGGINLHDMKGADFSGLTEDTELDIIRKLASYPDEVAMSAIERTPNRLAGYALDLAGLFHSFYNSHRVINEDPDLTMARLALSGAVRTVIANVLGLLGISAPHEM